MTITLTPALLVAIAERDALLARLERTAQEIARDLGANKAADDAAIKREQEREHMKGR